jgi:Ca2+-binding RTX toxin-like protein
LLFGAAEGAAASREAFTDEFAEVGTMAEPDCPDSAGGGADPSNCAGLPPNAGVEQGLPVTFLFGLEGVGGCPGAAGAGDRLILGTEAGEALLGTPEDDVICSLGGKDSVKALDGQDFVYGAEGHDKLKGGRVSDLLVGGPGRDKLLGQGGADVLVGSRGNDVLIGGAGFDDFLGGAGKDVCRLGTSAFYRSCENQRGK